MSFLDKFRRKASKAATRAVDDHGDQIARAVDRAAALADRKTGGKHSRQIDAGQEKVKDALDGLDGRNDDIR